jgi:hypothetical protein
MVKPQSPEAGKWKVNEERNKKTTFKPMFDYLLNKYTKAGQKDRAMKRPRSPIRQERRKQLKQAKPTAKERELQKKGTIRGFFNLHTLLFFSSTSAHLARWDF